nr:hypothetical protein CFP56_70797 [Quercus suber]
MLIRPTLPNYFVIRFAICGLRIIAPLGLLYSAYRLLHISVFRLDNLRLPLPVDIWLVAESAFYLLAYLPLNSWLQSEAEHPRPLERRDRELLFRRCLDTIDDVAPFLSAWFLGSPLRDIRRENINEFYAWSFFNKRYPDVSDDELTELNHYTDMLEQKSGFSFGHGRGKARSLRGTLDGVPTQHRPILWYLIVFVVDCISSIRLLRHSYTFHPPGWKQSVAIFPPRLPHLLRWNRHKAPRLSYWYREHTSKTSLPILFVHGINVGLYAYVDFLEQLASSTSGKTGPTDGDVGILAVELLPIGSSICPPLPLAADLRSEIRDILRAHEWEDFVVVGHSFGTAVVANMLRDPEFSTRIKASLLMDPICFLLHLPDVAFNFTRRLPSRANEFMLHYFSSQDLLISHTLARRFFWSDHTMWKEDIEQLPLTVILSGQDLIVPTRAVWRYLTETDVVVRDTESSRLQHGRAGEVEWVHGSVRVLWFDAFDHAGLFASKGARRAVARIALQYSQNSPRTCHLLDVLFPHGFKRPIGAFDIPGERDPEFVACRRLMESVYLARMRRSSILQRKKAEESIRDG